MKPKANKPENQKGQKPRANWSQKWSQSQKPRAKWSQSRFQASPTNVCLQDKSQKPKARWSQSQEPSEAEAKRSYFPAFISRSMEYVVQLSLCIFSLRILREIRVLFPFFPVTWSSSKQYSQEPSEAKTKRQKPGEAKANSQVKPKSQKPWPKKVKRQKAKSQ